MALFQSKSARNAASPNIYQAGTVGVQRLTHSLTANLGSGDVLELACLPAGCVPTRLSLMLDTDATGGLTAKVGFLSGSYGDDSAVRTIGTEFISAGALTSKALVDIPLDVLCGIARDNDRHRGIGIQPSANITMGTKKVHLILEYTA